MDLNCFRDRLFDLLNDSEGMGIADINADEAEQPDCCQDRERESV